MEKSMVAANSLEESVLKQKNNGKILTAEQQKAAVKKTQSIRLPSSKGKDEPQVVINLVEATNETNLHPNHFRRKSEMEELKKRMKGKISDNLRSTAVCTGNKDSFCKGSSMRIEYISGDLMSEDSPWIAPLESILGSYREPGFGADSPTKFIEKNP